MDKILYLRKSQNDNPDESVEETLKRHEQQLQEYALKQFGHFIEEKNIYREVISGGEDISERVEFAKVLRRVEAGSVSHVLFLDTARISRTGIYGAGDIINTFFYTNTLICTPTKIYDLSNEYDKKFLEMELLQSADFLSYVKKVLIRGRVHSVSSLGLFIGSKAPFGYSKKKLKKGYTLEANKDAETVKMIFELLLNGVGTSNIANHLNTLDIKPVKNDVWTPEMVRNILTKETYAGLLTWGKRKTVIKIHNGKKIKTRPLNKDYLLVKGLHKPIIPIDDFNKAQDILKSHKNSKTPKSKTIQNPLASLVVCSVCKRSMIRRPYSKPTRKNKKRVYEVDKEALLSLLRESKDKSGLSLTRLAKELDVTKDVVVSWFTPNINKFYLSTTFTEKWYDLKELLCIETDVFDKSITTYEEPSIQEDTLICSLPHCENVSSNLSEVEQAIIDGLKGYLKEFNHFLDNYEEEIKKVVTGNLKLLEKVNNKIDKLKKEKKNALRNFNAEYIDATEYMELKKEIELELEQLEEEKAKLEANKQEDKVIKIKKAIPILEKVLADYDLLNNEDKNNLLKSIIKQVIYLKKEKSTKKKKAEFDLEIHLLI